jgi:adenylate kinase family enzyme
LRASRTAGRFDDKNEVLLCLDQGRLLPSEYVLPLLEAEIEAGKQLGHRGIILDGFPRSLSQGIEFETSVGSFPFAAVEAHSAVDTKVQTRHLPSVSEGNCETALP